MKRVLLLLLALAHPAAPAAAPSCDELNRLFAASYRPDFKIAWASEPFGCPSKEAALALAMHDLGRVSRGDWLYETMVRSIKLISRAERCDPGVTARTSRVGVMHLCDFFFDRDRVARPAILFHEVGHARVLDPGHVVCDHGLLRGKVACDQRLTETMYEGSGYNYQLWFLAYAYRPSGQDLERAVVRKAMEQTVYNRFNIIPPGKVKEWLP